MQPALHDLLHLVGRSPLAQAAAIVIGTFILEDATTVLVAIAAAQGAICVPLALIALYVGVSVGDMGLYGLGRLASSWPPARAWITLPKGDRGRAWFARNVLRATAISRFVPGARLPIYTASGFFHAPFARFALAAVLATLVWTSLLFFLSMTLGHRLSSYLGAWRWAGAIGFAITVTMVGRVIAKMNTPDAGAGDPKTP